jgi:hypothetical protein
MWHPRKRVGSVRFLLVSTAVGVIVLAGGAAIAIAAYPSDSVAVYTGCLNTSGTSSGNVGNFAVGSNPAKPCGMNQVLIHLSGGTITKVSAGTGVNVSGVGGTGYVNNGYATVGIDPKYQLPQTSCSSGQFVASDGSGGWSCKDQKTYSGTNFALSNQSCSTGQFLTGIDSSGLPSCANDQTYSNGSGLDLSGNMFSLKSGYQLPQGCNSGQVATSDGSNTWSCQSGVGSLYTYSISGGYVTVGDPLSLDGDTESSYAYCNSGDIATGGGEYTDHVDQVYNGPQSSNGWRVTGSTGAFSQGHVRAFVVCLHL